MRRVILISAKNEGPRLAKVLANLKGIAEELQADLRLVGSNGSTDGTEMVFSPFGQIYYSDKGGKAPALMEALGKAFRSGKYSEFITMDGDGQHDPNYLFGLVKTLSKNAAILGSRYHKESPRIGQPPLDRLTLNIAVQGWFRLIKSDLTDPLCGFRIFNHDCVEWTLKQNYVTLGIDGYGFEIETAIRLHAAGLPIIEVPHPAIYTGLDGKEQIYNHQYLEPRLERIRMHQRHFILVTTDLDLPLSPLC